MAIKILEDKQLGFGEGIGAYGFEVYVDAEQDMRTYWSGRNLESQLQDAYGSGLYLLPSGRVA